MSIKYNWLKIINNYGNNYHYKVLKRLKKIVFHVEHNFAQNKKMTQQLSKYIDNVKSDNSYSSFFNHLLIESSKNTGKIFAMPLIGIAEKIMMFVFQSPYQFIFLFCFLLYSIIIYVIVKALGCCL